MLLILTSVSPRLIELFYQEQANHILLRALDFDTQSDDSCLGKPQLKVRNRKGVVDARERWQQVSDAWSGSQRSFRQLGLISLAMDERPEAVRNFTLAEDPISRLLLARLAVSDGQFDKAAAVLAQDYPTSWRFLLQRSANLTLRGETTEALACSQIVAQWNVGEEPLALIARGHVRQILGQHAAALSDFNQAIAHCPTCYRAYLYRAQTALVSGTSSLDAIEADLLQAVSLAPDQRDAALSWGQWLQYHARYAEAEVQFKRWIDIHPNDFEAVWSLSNIYCTTKRSDEGKRVLDEFSGHYPEEAQNNQARLLQQREQCASSGAP